MSRSAILGVLLVGIGVAVGWFAKPAGEIVGRAPDRGEFLDSEVQALRSELEKVRWELESKRAKPENVPVTANDPEVPEPLGSLEVRKNNLIGQIETELELEDEKIKRLAAELGSGSGVFEFYAARLPEKQVEELLLANFAWRTERIEEECGVRVPWTYMDELRREHEEAWKKFREWRSGSYLASLRRALTVEELNACVIGYAKRVAELQSNLLRKAHDLAKNCPEMQGASDRALAFLR